MRLGRELHPVVRQDGMHLIGQLIQHPAQKFGGYEALGARMPFGKRRLAGAVDGDEEVLLAFFGLQLRKIDVQLADGMVLKLLFRRALPLLAQGQSADAVPLKTAG